jgi:hypothetical protein
MCASSAALQDCLGPLACQSQPDDCGATYCFASDSISYDPELVQVLYSLPELDGAIDTIPLGGLVRDDIYLIPERIMRLAARIRKWVDLRRKSPAERSIAVLLYGFPPGVGAIGTAALLDVPTSLENLLRALRRQVHSSGLICQCTCPMSTRTIILTTMREVAQRHAVAICKILRALSELQWLAVCRGCVANKPLRETPCFV